MEPEKLNYLLASGVLFHLLWTDCFENVICSMNAADCGICIKGHM
jgi:hypothetical protein